MIPEAIQRRLADRERPRPRADRDIRPGDIRRAASGGVERLVLVLKVNPARENAQVTLVHATPDDATSADLVIEPSVAGTTFPIVVEAAMRGVVWVKDLGRLVTEVPRGVVDACLSPAQGLPAGDGMWTGLAMEGPLDARWAFKESERETLAQLCSSCTEASLEHETIGLDVDEVFMALLEPADDAARMMEAIVDLWHRRRDRLIFTYDHVDLLESNGLLAVDRWVLALGDDGRAFRLGPLEQLINRALEQFSFDVGEPDSVLGPVELATSARAIQEF